MTRDDVDRALAEYEPGPGDPSLADLLRAHIEAAERMAGGDLRPLPAAVPVLEIADPMPDPLLSLAGKGAVLTRGEVCLLAGEGGVGKSALLAGLAVDVADALDRVCPAGPLQWHGGAGAGVLLATYEDRPGVWRRRCEQYLTATAAPPEALAGVRVLNLRGGWPLFGPPAGAAFYNRRPEPLAGWQALADAARAHGPALIVIDPALSAFVGEPNAAGPVREFLGALSALADDHATGVLLAAHSNKATRGKGKADPFDPGLVGGSAAWHDGVRGVLALATDPELPGARQLACPKANYGPARMLAGLAAVEAPDGDDPVGFRLRSGAGWHRPHGAVDRTGGNDGEARARAEI